jgi:hypothetical protein
MFTYSFCLLCAVIGQSEGTAINEQEATGAASQAGPNEPYRGTLSPPAEIDFRTPPSYGNGAARSQVTDTPSPPLVTTGQRDRDASANADARQAAESLLRHALTKPDEASIEGSPLALKTLLEQSLGSPRQLDVVRGYWRLCAVVCDYHFAVEEARTLNELPASSDVYHQALLHAAQAAAKARAAEARLHVDRAQHDLAEAALLTETGDLPLPGDAPFVGVYRTYFDELNSRGAAPKRLRRIDRCLPLIRVTIENRSVSALAAEDAFLATRRMHEEGRVDLRTLLGAHESLRGERRDFLASVEEYNRQIAEYALSVTVPATTSEQLLGMLIKPHRDDQSVLATKTRTDGSDGTGIRRVSNEAELNEPSGVPAARP